MTTLYDIYKQHPIVTTDSRRCPAGSIFFALKGDNFDGNLFAAKALESGSAFAVVDNAGVATDQRYIVVDDVLATLQQLAATHRRHLDIPVVGITGTNGKTTTKELITAVLSRKYRTSATVGNLNNHIGVPLTLLAIPPDSEIAVVEMGANHPGEIAQLAAIVRPTHALITNVGKAHLEGFGSIQGVLETKTALYRQVCQSGGHIFVNAADPLLADSITGYRPTTRYSADDSVKADIEGCAIWSASPLLTVEWNGNTIQSRFIGSYNANNILAAIAVGSHFGVTECDIIAAIEDYTPGNSRSQLMTTPHNTLIIDAYNANPTSMTAAIDSFAAIDAPHKLAILGDMLELGTHSAAEHRRIVDRLTQLGIDAMLVGSEFAGTQSPFNSFPNCQSLIDYLTTNPITAHTILLKGSNGIGLKAAVEYL